MNIQLEIENLKIQTGFYKDAIYSISKTGYSELTSVIGPMLTVNETSLRSIILLAEANKILSGRNNNLYIMYIFYFIIVVII